MNRRSTDLETSVGHADNKDEERFKLTGKQTSVEINVCDFNLNNKLTYQINHGYGHHLHI